MFPVKGAIFTQLKLFLSVSPVFRGGVVPPLTLGTLQGYQFNRRFLACHNKLLI
jgi:hypothetical protein